MLGGYVGRILRVNLTDGTCRDEGLPPEDVLRKYIGGDVLALKILYDEVPLEAKPLDPENRLIFMTGPLTGTVAPCANNCSVASLSHDTGYTIGVGHFHGRFGPMLKYAGYDAIIFEGASENPVYLWIREGKAELRDGSKLWGKDTHETYDLVRGELGEPEAAVACIGPAGETMMMSAAVCTDYHHMAAKGGIGSVMGAKKLKAVACYGTKGIAVNDPEGLLDVSLAWQKDMRDPRAASAWVKNAGVIQIWYNFAGQASFIAYKNLSDPEGAKEFGRSIQELAKESKIRPQACLGCPVACAYRIEVGAGPRKGFIATPSGGGENLEASGAMLGVIEGGTTYWLGDLFDRLGWNSSTPSMTLSLLIELYERGIIDKKDTDGLELKWGNADAIYELVQKMLKREGIGKVLAEGPKATAEYLGGDAAKYAVHVKGTGIRLHDWRPSWGTVFADLIACFGPGSQGGVLDPTVRNWEGLAARVRQGSLRSLWFESIGVCTFSTGPNATTYINRALAATTGEKEYSPGESMEVGERAINLARVFSVRRGHTPEHDLDYGGRYLEAPASGAAKGATVAPHLKDLLVDYYTVMGWVPNTGKPKEETLARLGLRHYWKDIADLTIPIGVEEVKPLDVASGKASR